MYCIIFPVLAMILLASLVHISPYTTVIVSFVKGRYEPATVQAAGGIRVEELKGLGMVKAVIPQNAVSSLAQNPAVEFVEIDGQFEVAEASSTSIEYSGSWALQDIGAEVAHSLNYTGRGVKIAVLDTGIDYNHPDLASNYKGGYNFIDNNNDPMDDNGHGTHVAGILAAVKDAKNGLEGVAPDAELYAVKVSDSHGKGSFSGLVKGINWAIENHMEIVTMSITGQGGSQALAKAVNTAYNDYGLILVAAVGNGSGNTKTILYPAGYDEVIGVGCVDKENNLCSFSLTGSEVELVAPGSGIKSAAIGGGYRIMSGTSMATPFVTGTVALLLGSDEKDWCKTAMVDCDGKWTNDEVRQVLRGTAKHLGDEGKNDLYGYGLLYIDFSQEQEKQLPQPTNSFSAIVATDVGREEGADPAQEST